MSGPVGIDDLLHGVSSLRTRVTALIFVATMLVIALAAIRLGNLDVPAVPSLVTICATLWAAAELLTAYLLLSQFAVNGVRAFLVLGAGYALSGLLTIPYLAFYPGLFLPTRMNLNAEQISIYLWTSWHLIFPVLVGAYYAVDGGLSERIVDSAEIRTNLLFTIALIGAGALAITGWLYLDVRMLPPLIDHGRFTPLWNHGVAPVIIAINAFTALLIVTLRRPSRLQVWIGVALATSALDAFLNAFSAGRFNLSWYVGKFETMTTASIVLVVLLSEVGEMYRRLGAMATLDVLTGLPNRRAFDDHVRWALRERRLEPSDLSFLVLDVDYFKGFNDRYGHATGDVALKRVARAIVESLHRSQDIVARFGGEEFVVLLPGTGAADSERVAERIRHAVEGLGITHGASEVYWAVTVSIGIAYVQANLQIDPVALFAVADRALFRAKERRNCTVVVPYAPDEAAPVALVPQLATPSD